MKNPLKTERAHAIGLLAARVPLGVFFVVAGCSKLGKFGMSGFAKHHLHEVPKWFSRSAGEMYLTALPFVEIVIGVMLVVGFLGRLAGGIATLIVLSVVLAKQRFAEADSIHHDLLYFGLSIALMCLGTGAIGVDSLIWGKKKPEAPPV